jgi:hypothetical protein
MYPAIGSSIKIAFANRGSGAVRNQNINPAIKGLITINSI